MSTVLDLPDDILSIIFAYLPPRDFLRTCQTCKVLYTTYQKDPLYWRTITSTTFRTPISPLLKADGARWYHLYRRLKTQTRLYTWGQGLKGNLGRGIGLPRRGPAIRGPRGRNIPIRSPRMVFQRTSSPWPTEAHVPDDVGVIADLQCGGWSTIILSASGQLFATGSINSANFINVGIQTDQFEKLNYLTQSTSAISSFSAGRTHILALTDDNEVLSWDRINAKGLKVLSRYDEAFGKAIRVVAGWAESSAYVPEKGLLYWKHIVNDQEDDHLDAIAVKEKTIPRTAQTLNKSGTIVQVVAHIVLEGFIVYLMSDSRLYAVGISHENPEDTEPQKDPFLLQGYFDGTDEIQDVQGSFRNFAVFTKSGRVLAGNVGYLERCKDAAYAAANDTNMEAEIEDVTGDRPKDLPILQNSGVISVAFGDWHYHALYSNGKITSHGQELEHCGALGLGTGHDSSMLRGKQPAAAHLRQEARLQPGAERRGRQVWFEPEKKQWLEDLYSMMGNGASPEDLRAQFVQHPDRQTMFSEWIEQEGRHWEDGPYSNAKPAENTDDSPDQDFHLDSYFAVAIGAAGWHSGALLLIDDEKAERVKNKWLTPKEQKDETEHETPVPGQFPQGSDEGRHFIWKNLGFPRVRLPDGSEFEIPPSVADRFDPSPRPWRDGMPTLDDLNLNSSAPIPT